MRRPSLLIVITVLGLLAQQTQGESSGVTYSKHWINRTRVHVVSIDLNDRTLKITPALAGNAIGRRQSFVGFMARHHPLAQITGSFFSLRTAYPIGDLVIDGKIVFRGPVGSALAIRPDNQAEMLNIPYGWTYSWPGYESAMKGGIRLMQNGQYAVYPRQQGFRDPALFRPATRTAIGLTNGNHLLMVAVNRPIYLSNLAAIMKALGCCDAMALDGGTSTGLACGDDVILMPGRTLTNVLMVIQRPEPPEKPVDEPQTAPDVQAAAMIPEGGGKVTMPGPATAMSSPQHPPTTSAFPVATPQAAKPAPRPPLGDILRHVLRSLLLPFAL